MKIHIGVDSSKMTKKQMDDFASSVKYCLLMKAEGIAQINWREDFKDKGGLV